MYNNVIQFSQTDQSSDLLFLEWRKFKISKTKEYDNLPSTNHMNFIIKNWHNLDCLNEKFNELREKEINNIISEFEKTLLKDVLKKRILEFPNPYLPPDHKKAIQMSKKYGILKKEKSKVIFKIKEIFNIFSL